jgi:hypothetical protein
MQFRAFSFFGFLPLVVWISLCGTSRAEDSPLQVLDGLAKTLVQDAGSDLDYKELSAAKQAEKGREAIAKSAIDFVDLPEVVDESAMRIAAEKLSAAGTALFDELRELPENRNLEKRILRVRTLTREQRQERYWKQVYVPHSSQMLARLWILQGGWAYFESRVAQREARERCIQVQQKLQNLMDRMIVRE